jgi:NAD(P)-dependent dehydrogenase (short-subunit alcohol dehydrogenase family)
MVDLAGQTAFVTGATGGIGRSVALALARKGVHLHLIARDRAKAEILARELSGAAPNIRTHVHTMDLSQDIRGSVGMLTKDDPALDILVHGAGSISLKSFESTDESELDLQYRVNVRAPFLLTKLLLPHIRKRRGQIVFVNSSVAQQKAKAHLSAYAASKYALMAIADSLRDEVNDDGIRVLSIYPGRTATPMQESIFAFENRPYQGDQLLQPDDVAEAMIAALALPRTAEVTDIFIRPLKRIAT